MALLRYVRLYNSLYLIIYVENEDVILKIS